MRALIRYQWQLHPWGVTAALLETLFTAATAVASPWLVGRLVVELPGVLEGGSPTGLVLAASVLVAVLVAAIVLGGVTTTLYQDLSLRTERDVMIRLTRLCLSGPRIDTLESPDFLDRVGRVRNRVWQIDQGFMASLMTLNTGLVLVGATISVGVLVGWWWAALLALAAIGDSWLDARLGRWQQRSWNVSTEPQRHADYAFSLGGPSAAREIRLFGLSALVARRFWDLTTAALRPSWRRRRVAAGWQVAAMLVRTAVAVLAVLGVVGQAVRGELPIAAAAVAVPLVLQLAGVQVVGAERAAQGIAVLADLRATEQQLDLHPGPVPATTTVPRHPRVPSAAVPAAVRFEGVRFEYPGRAEPVLDGLNLDLWAGEQVGLVGVNGAGKSTVIKLLTGGLRPQRGQVLVDGVPLDAEDDEALGRWQRQIAVLTQDFAHYPVTAAGNIAAGIGLLDGDPGDPTLARAVELGSATDVVRSLRSGWDTVLDSRYTDGQDLSGGQWQRIGLARVASAVGAGARLVVLDEPAAALDTRSEDFLVRRHVALTGGVTSVIVSHRFSVLRPLPRIVVLDGGRIVEDGSHDTLMDLDGRYARLFRLQATRLIGRPA